MSLLKAVKLKLLHLSNHDRLRVRRIFERVYLKLSFMIKERRPEVLTLFSRSNDLSVSRGQLSKSKDYEIFENHGTFFFNFESTCDLTDVTADYSD